MEIIKGSIPLGLIAAFAGAVIPVYVLATGLQTELQTEVQTELQTEIPARGPIPFNVFDHDANGFISAEEFDATRNARMAMKASENRPMHGKGSMCSFTDIDKDGDGKLTKEELSSGQHAHMQARREMMRQGKGMGPGMGHGMGMNRNMPAFADFDTDGDGKIVEVEFSEARQQRINEMEQQGRQMKNISHAPSFTDIDLNHDGEISRDEFSSHQSERHQNMMSKQ